MMHRTITSLILVTAVLLLAGPVLGSDDLVLPTTMCSDFFIAEVSINGQGPWPMVVDSGAASTVLSDHVAGIIGGVDEVQSLSIGEFKARGNLHIFSRSMDQLSHALGTRIEGIVGHPVFQKVLLTYDYPGRELRVGSGNLPDEGQGIVPTGKEKRPYVDVRIGGKRFMALIDTGSGRGLTLSRKKRYRYREPLRPTGATIRINGLFFSRAGRLAGEMKLGPLTLQEPIIHEGVKKGYSGSLVGQQILRGYVLTFDQLNRRMRFEGPVDKPLQFEPFYGIGAAFDPKEKGFPVVAVFPGSGAEAAGLKVGDILLAKDGVNLWERDCPEDAAYATEPLDIVLTILRDGEEVDLTITTRALVP
ncbi:MAG: PDZ domain-containing protein [Acidobacteria bacterium]|uniref:PDZ domain-containing protein n=1 Tax=Candidatus Polarisedimenticola svalbardensis TaxID=2886004 RepID=A0A8J6Y161_9BACT|nr:PDZ domain-containing protein [Candidatus Polarisedimenticola svalbardensis]